MSHFAKIWSSGPIGQQPVAQLPWGHNIVLLQKLSTNSKRVWYARQTIENGWSRNVLGLQIESDLYARQNSQIKNHNFEQTLPPLQSDLARQIIKDPYIFDFIGIESNAREREIEIALLGQIQKFLLELGTGFAYLGSQIHLVVGGKDYYLDLLFYHTKLHCHVVIELKAGEFKPEYVGKLNFYLSAVDDLFKTESDRQSIGLLLCKTKDKVTVEYTLKDTAKPMGVSEFRLKNIMPEPWRKVLPSAEDIEKGLQKRKGTARQSD